MNPPSSEALGAASSAFAQHLRDAGTQGSFERRGGGGRGGGVWGPEVGFGVGVGGLGFGGWGGGGGGAWRFF